MVIQHGAWYVTPEPTQTKPIGWIIAAAAAAAAAIFILDLVTPLSIAVPMLYVIPILLTRYIPGWRSTVFLSGSILLLLTWVPLALLFDHVTPQVVGNRVMASFLLLVVAGLLLKQKHLAQQRARDQAALRESEERFAKAFRVSPHPIGITEAATGRCIEVNEACLQLFGFCREEVIGNTTLMLGIWPNLEDRARLIERLKAGQPVRNLEGSFKAKSGEVRRLLVSSDMAELNGTLCLITVGNDITERKRVEEALRRTELYYRTIFQEAGVGVAQVDSRTGQFLKVNRKYCEMVGLTEDEMLATTFMRLTHPDDLAEDLGYLERLRSGELSTFTMEKRYVKKDGSIVWVILNVASLWQVGEMPSQHTAVVHDITARKQMETALRESEERLLLALDSASMGTWEWDSETDLLLWNDRQFKLFDIRPENFHGTGAEALSRIHSEDRARVAAAVRGVMKEGVMVREEFRVIHADGSVRWLFGSGRPVQDERDRCRHVVGVCLDITERRRVQEETRILNETLEGRVRERTAALAEANERWGWVVRATTDGVWDWDLVRDTAYFSPRWKEMHGFQERDSLESTNEWRMRIHPDDRQSVLASLEAYLRGEKADFWEEYRIQRKNGIYLWVLDRGVAIFNEQGLAVRMVGAETDITWRKESETLLRERETQLRELSARLLRAQEEERRRISRDLHDDVMQRMGVLTLDLYGLVSSAASPDGELQSQLKACGASAEQLTTDLQRMARQLHPSILEFGGLEVAARELVDEFATRTGLSAELLTQNLPKDIPLDHATCLYRVLQEGLQNVQKHAAATIVLVRLLGTGKGVGLCIHDDGHGFEAVDGVSRRKGLGLTSMAERVGMLHGTFRIRTKPGDGTELHAWVPVEKDGRGS